MLERPGELETRELPNAGVESGSSPEPRPGPGRLGDADAEAYYQFRKVYLHQAITVESFATSKQSDLYRSDNKDSFNTNAIAQKIAVDVCGVPNSFFLSSSTASILCLLCLMTGDWI